MRGKISATVSRVFSTLILVSIASSSTEQVEKEWIARHNGPADLNDGAYAMTIDTAGNV